MNLVITCLCLFFVQASIIVNASDLALPETQSVSNDIFDNDESNVVNSISDETVSRVRRSCDCRRKSGECVAYGTYQCSSRREATVVQCVGYKWVRIGFCPNSCRILSNNQPYCF